MLPKMSLRFSPKFLSIAWILIGLMVGGSLFDYLAANQAAGACVELRVLEQEDDRTDHFSDLLYVPTHTMWCLSSPSSSEEVMESPKLDVWAFQKAAHLERGPPSLVWAIDLGPLF